MSSPNLPEPKDDGLFCPEVGPWSRDKHHFLLRYVDAFTTAMRKKRWSALYYIDLFSGAGINRIKGSGQLEWGSPLIAVLVQRFSAVYLAEQDPKKREVLAERASRCKGKQTVRIFDDANSAADDLKSSMMPESLSLCFIDPYGLHFDFSYLAALTESRPVDLIVYFPDNVDINRNVEAYYKANPDSRLDRFYGPCDWRSVWDATSPANRPAKMRELYEQQLRSIDYQHFAHEPIPSEGRPYYRLVFSSKHKAGVKIWRGISKIKPGGQRTFFD